MQTKTPNLLAAILIAWPFFAHTPLVAQAALTPPAGLVGWWPGDTHLFPTLG